MGLGRGDVRGRGTRQDTVSNVSEAVGAVTLRMKRKLTKRYIPKRKQKLGRQGEM